MRSSSRQVLEGLTILVTGAANGVGRVTALLGAERGARLVLLDRDRVGLDAVAAELHANGHDPYIVVADISVESEVKEAFSSAVANVGRIHVVLSAAGVMRGQRLDIREFTEAIWDSVIDVNLKGAFFISKYAATHLLPEGGTLVLVASRSGVTLPSGSIAYGASKGGIHGLALSLDKQLRSAGLRVHTLCPGDVDTPLMRASLQEALSYGADPGEIEKIRSSLGTAEDVARVLLLLAEPTAATLSGTVFTV